MNEKIDVLDFKIFKAQDEPEESHKFHQGHQQVLLQRGLESLDFAKNTWIENPSVYLMALYSGDKIIAGSRIHVFHPDLLYPFEEALIKHDTDLHRALNRYDRYFQAEWCGLWSSGVFRGWGLTQVLKRAAIAHANSMGLEILYGICPRHTMDLFRTVGFHFVTLDDEVIRFPYPTDAYLSYIIQCEVASMEFVFKEDKKLIDLWLDDPMKEFMSKGNKAECIIRPHGFPESESTLLLRPDAKVHRPRHDVHEEYLAQFRQ